MIHEKELLITNTDFICHLFMPPETRKDQKRQY